MDVWRLHPPRTALPCLVMVYSVPRERAALEYQLGKLRTYMGQWGLAMVGYFSGPKHVAHAPNWVAEHYAQGLPLIHVPDDANLYNTVVAWHERLRLYVDGFVAQAQAAGHEYLYVEPMPPAVMLDPHERFLGQYLSISGFDDRVTALDDALDAGFLHVGTSASFHACVMPFDPVVEHDQLVRSELAELRREERLAYDQLIAAQARGDEITSSACLHDLQVIAARVRAAEESLFAGRPKDR